MRKSDIIVFISPINSLTIFRNCDVCYRFNNKIIPFYAEKCFISRLSSKTYSRLSSSYRRLPSSYNGDLVVFPGISKAKLFLKCFRRYKQYKFMSARTVEI